MTKAKPGIVQKIVDLFIEQNPAAARHRAAIEEKFATVLRGPMPSDQTLTTEEFSARLQVLHDRIDVLEKILTALHGQAVGHALPARSARAE